MGHNTTRDGAITTSNGNMFQLQAVRGKTENFMQSTDATGT